MPPKKPAPKRKRFSPEMMIKDMAKDYTKLLSEWRKRKRRFIKDYENAAVIQEKMVCENCKEIVDIESEIIVNKDGSGNTENPHCICIPSENDGLRSTLDFSCCPRTYNQCFRDIKINCGEGSSSDSSSDSDGSL
jgi:hypothetical protein